jgi:phage baseplate assembly protein W
VSGYSWSMPPAAPATSTSLPERARQRDRLWGRDLWLDVRVTGADLVTTAAKDLAIVDGEECLRQALIRRIVTAPGEWATLPEYGCGARLYVKARNTPATRAELAERIRAQLTLEARVERVQAVSVEVTADGQGLKINVIVVPKGRVRPEAGLPITLEVR